MKELVGAITFGLSDLVIPTTYRLKNYQEKTLAFITKEAYKRFTAIITAKTFNVTPNVNEYWFINTDDYIGPRAMEYYDVQNVWVCCEFPEIRNCTNNIQFDKFKSVFYSENNTEFKTWFMGKNCRDTGRRRTSTAINHERWQPTGEPPKTEKQKQFIIASLEYKSMYGKNFWEVQKQYYDDVKNKAKIKQDEDENWQMVKQRIDELLKLGFFYNKGLGFYSAEFLNRDGYGFIFVPWSEKEEEKRKNDPNNGQKVYIDPLALVAEVLFDWDTLLWDKVKKWDDLGNYKDMKTGQILEEDENLSLIKNKLMKYLGWGEKDGGWGTYGTQIFLQQNISDEAAKILGLEERKVDIIDVFTGSGKIKYNSKYIKHTNKRKLKGGAEENKDFNKDSKDLEDIMTKYEMDLNTTLFYIDQLDNFTDEFKWLLDWSQWFLKV